MIQKAKDSKWTDHRGNEVPRQYVDRFDVKKEAVIGKLTTDAMALNRRLAQFKEKAFGEADELYAEMLKNADLARSDRKGNYTLYNFDKSVKLTVDVSDRIEFDENINFAQQKINDFLVEKTNGADAELAVLVNNAFSTTKGRLDTKRIFQLFQLKITHPLWQQAMDLIRKSIQTNSSVRYLTFYTRGAGDKYDIINLNFSNV
jgi:hypothetical protein